MTFRNLATCLHLLIGYAVIIEVRCQDATSGCPGGSAFCGGNWNTGACYTGAVSWAGWYSCCQCASGCAGLGWPDPQTCFQCSSGTYSSQGSSSCITCPSGQFSGPGASTCFGCPSGTFFSSTGFECRVCENGTYLAAGVVGACINCPLGTYTVQSGSADVMSCSVCAPGWFGSVNKGGATNDTGCLPCQRGYFSLANATTCTACPVGFTTSSTKGTSTGSCGVCSQGYFLSASGCTACPQGLSTPVSSAGTSASDVSWCTICAAGWLMSKLGKCAPCPAGTWSEFGLNLCHLCPPGTYSHAGATSCSLCPDGTFGDRAGLATAACSGVCASCVAGSTTALHAPLTCSAGAARAVPASLGLQILPAANAANLRGVDLLVAPLALCRRMTSAAACAAADSVAGADGVTRYVVGTAAAFNVEPAEALTCGAAS